MKVVVLSKAAFVELAEKLPPECRWRLEGGILNLAFLTYDGEDVVRLEYSEG